MPVTAAEYVGNAPKELADIRDVSDSAWYLLTRYFVPETMVWFGLAAKSIAENKQTYIVTRHDIKTVIQVIQFPVDPELPEYLPYIGKVQFVSEQLVTRGVIIETADFEDEAYWCLLRIGARSLELVLTLAEVSASSERSKLIDNRHIMSRCDDYPYPLNLFLC